MHVGDSVSQSAEGEFAGCLLSGSLRLSSGQDWQKTLPATSSSTKHVGLYALICLVDWISDTRSQGYTDLYALICKTLSTWQFKVVFEN